jgi:beta-glucosidase-like glycosyl hydrolase
MTALAGALLLLWIGLGTVTSVAAQPLSPDERARQTEQQMTDDERFSLLVSLMGAVPSIGVPRDPRIPPEVNNMSAGYTPGIPRLGVPALQSSDASMGVTNPGYRPDDKGATAFPASIAVGSSFNPRLAREGGAAIGREARSRGFNIQLAGGISLQRDVRNGRNFEYYSEDPLVSAVFGAEAVNGIQGAGVISTLKHFTLNCNETNRHWLDAIIDPAAHRESDLLAFQIAIERSEPGAIMSGYNKVNGEYVSGNHHLLNDVLKGAWGYKGYVMSDWGAVPEWQYALKGLDQESGRPGEGSGAGASAGQRAGRRHRREKTVQASQVGPVHLLGGDGPAVRPLDGHRRHGVGRHEDLEAAMRRLARGRIAAHLGHEARDDDLLDPVPPEVLLERGVGERPRQVLGEDRLAGVRPRGRVDLERRAPGREGRRVRPAALVDDVEDRHTLRAGPGE